jgi:hypothetical protein
MHKTAAILIRRRDTIIFVTRQQQNQRADQQNCAGGNKRTNYEDTCQSTKITRWGRAGEINTKNHSKKISNSRTNEDNRRVNKGWYSVPRPSKTMLPIEKNCANERESWR